MQNLKNNIKFNYEYRDAGNYNKSSSVIFRNCNGINNLEIAIKEIRECLFDHEFFYPYKLSIPQIHIENWNPKLDHDWYRFTELEFTHQSVTDSRTFNKFLSDLKQKAKQFDL